MKEIITKNPDVISVDAVSLYKPIFVRNKATNKLEGLVVRTSNEWFVQINSLEVIGKFVSLRALIEAYPNYLFFIED